MSQQRIGDLVASLPLGTADLSAIPMIIGAENRPAAARLRTELESTNLRSLAAEVGYVVDIRNFASREALAVTL